MNSFTWDTSRKLEIRPRRDHILNWIHSTEILRKNEICVVFWEGQPTSYKLGDGEHKFTELPFINSLEEVIDKGYLYSEDKVISLRGFTKPVEGDKFDV